MKTFRFLDSFDSPSNVWDRRLLFAGNAADDMKEQGIDLGGGVALEEDTLLHDVKDTDFEEGYGDDVPPPEDYPEEDGTEDKRVRDNQRWAHQQSQQLKEKDEEIERLKKQVAAQGQAPVQPYQPAIQQPATPTANPYQQEMQAARKELDLGLASLSKDDPNHQSKAVQAWANYNERLMDAKVNAREHEQRQYQDQMQRQATEWTTETERALRDAGLEVSQAMKDRMQEKALGLNTRQPGWDQGMAPRATYDHVANLVKQETSTVAHEQDNIRRANEQHLRSAGGSMAPGGRAIATRRSGKDLSDPNNVKTEEERTQYLKKQKWHGNYVEQLKKNKAERKAMVMRRLGGA